jgi:hypothetical protein
LLRFFAGAAACFLLMTGAFLMWQSKAAEPSRFPDAPAARAYDASMLKAQNPLRAPEASPKSREERRFSRADRNDDGKIVAEELLSPRRKAYAKLDKDGNGSLSFEEWAHTTIDKFAGADKDRNHILTAAEYATTAPPPPKHKTCSCGRSYAARDDDDGE